jgi:hypothetical protein
MTHGCGLCDMQGSYLWHGHHMCPEEFRRSEGGWCWRAQEATKLWCLCKLPYNEDRPMLACDYCQDWFHYDCVGLRPPGDEEDDEDVAPPDFRCPSCCLKARL